MSPVLNETMQNRAFRAVFPLVLALLAPAAASARGTLDSILPEIRAQHPGRLSDAQPWTDGEGNTHYRIKWMTPEGRILFFDADARSGRYSSTGGADWRNRDGGRGDYGRDGRGEEETGPGDRRNHFAGEDGNGNGNGNDWRNRDPGNNPWTRGGGEWRDRGQGGGEWRNQRGGGNWGNRGGGGHGGGDNHRHGH
jgi:hypothetical protein